MNVKLLKRIKARILKEPDHFRMDKWTCGTAYCVGGWACVLSRVKLRVSHDYGELVKPTNYERLSSQHEVFVRAKKLLGLTTKQAERLFVEEQWPSGLVATGEASRVVKARLAASRIDHFIATKGRE